MVVPADLADEDERNRAAAAVLASGRVDILVNNAATVEPLGPTAEVAAAELRLAFEVNVVAPVMLAGVFLPAMRAAGWGRVVNISSLTVLGAVERTAYAAAKASLVSFSRSWALELARSGITVNAIAPGPTETALFRANNPPGSEGERRYLAAVPMARFGSPDEIAAAAAFLLSEDAGFITGQTLFVDGGASIGKAAV